MEALNLTGAFIETKAHRFPHSSELHAPGGNRVQEIILCFLAIQRRNEPIVPVSNQQANLRRAKVGRHWAILLRVLLLVG